MRLVIDNCNSNPPFWLPPDYAHTWVWINSRLDAHFSSDVFSVQVDTEANPPYKLVPRTQDETLTYVTEGGTTAYYWRGTLISNRPCVSASTEHEHMIPVIRTIRTILEMDGRFTLRDGEKSSFPIAKRIWDNRKETLAPSTCYHGISEREPYSCEYCGHTCRCGGLRSKPAVAPKPQVHVYTLSIHVGEWQVEYFAAETGLFPGVDRLYLIAKGSDENTLREDFYRRFTNAGYFGFSRGAIRVTKHSEVR